MKPEKTEKQTQKHDQTALPQHRSGTEMVRITLPPPPSLQNSESVVPAPEQTERQKPQKPQKPQKLVRQIVDQTTEDEGRVLLRLLEHGKGPKIEIQWPQQQQPRRQLRHWMGRCGAMRPALMDPDGNIYIAQGEPGVRWEINMDRYSGFVRQIVPLTEEDRQRQREIKHYHQLQPPLFPVYLLSRRIDAALLGGLSHQLGKYYETATKIQAAYRFQDRQLVIDLITVDQERMPNNPLRLKGNC